MKQQSLQYLSAFIILWLCETNLVLGHGPETKLDMNVLTHLVPGKSLKKDVRKHLGVPSRVINEGASTNPKGQGELWEFDRTGYLRVSVSSILPRKP